ncbi:phage tail tape measure protein [bacterium]|nr:MAG: phage tail tape measure protein [bacterium]
MAEKELSFRLRILGLSNEEKMLAQVQIAIGKVNNAKRVLKKTYESGKITEKQYATRLALLNKELREQTVLQKQLKKAITPTQSSFMRLGKTILTSLGIFASAAIAARALFNVIKNGFKTSWDFEYAMSAVKAITRSTGDEFESLRQSAISLGGATKYTASEVAGLQKEYAKLGFSITEILAITKATLDLAAATGSDLAYAATIAGATLRQFNLDSTKMTHVVDVMTAAFGTSALDMSKFETAMQNAGVTGAAVGESLESVTGKLAVLANSGLDASTSGTSLRNIFLELEKRGLTWDQAMRKIQGSQNRASTSLELFGKRGAVAGLILAENNKAAKDYNDSLLDVDGTSKEMADTMLDNVKGSITILKSAWEGLTLRINESNGAIKNFVDGLTTIVTGIGTKGTKNLNELFDDKKIISFNDRFKFFVAMGEGYWAAAKRARVNSNEEVQKLKDEFIAIGKDYQKQMDEITTTKSEAEAAKKKANKDELKRLEAEVEAEERRQGIEEKASKARYVVFKDEINNRKSQGKELLDFGQEQADAELKIIEEQVDKEIEEWNRGYDEWKEIEDEKKNLQWQMADETTKGLINIWGQYTKRKYDKQFSALETQYNADIKAAEDNEEQKAKIDKAYQDKKKQLMHKEDQSNKRQAIFESIIDTAKNVIKTLSKPLLIPWVIGMGAIQTALIAAQPLPKYKGGGKITDGVHVNTGKKDDTLILANKTETVLTDKHVAMLGGPRVMRNIGVPGYVEGGYIGTTPPVMQSGQPAVNIDFDRFTDITAKKIIVELNLNKVNSGLKELEIINTSEKL